MDERRTAVTEHDAGDHRRARTGGLRRTALAAIPLRLASAVSGLAVLGAASRTLDENQFATWAVVVTIATVSGAADLGIGGGLTSAVATSIAQGRTEDVRAMHGAASRLLSKISLGILFLTMLIVWPSRLLDSLASGPARIAAAAVVALVAVGLPFGASSRVLFGMQRGATANLISVASTTITSIAFVLAAVLGAPLWALAALATAGTTAGGVMSTIVLRRNFRSGSTGSGIAPSSRRLLASGRHFFVLAIASSLAFGADVFVLKGVADDATVAEYVAAYRLFTFAPMLTYLALAGLWPAVADSLARGDRDWIKAHLRKLTLHVLAANAAVTAVLLLTESLIVRIWLGNGFEIHTDTALVAAAYALVNAVATPITLIATGIGIVRRQAYANLVAAISNLGLSLALAPRFGAAGPIAASTLCLAATTLLLTRWSKRFLFHADLADVSGQFPMAQPRPV